MAYLPRGIAQPAELIKSLNSLAPYPPGVLKIHHTLGNDWTGDPAIYFWITLTDAAAHPTVLSETTRRVRNHIEERVNPSQWDLIPYFNFRSQSEQAKLKEEVFG